MEQGQGAEHHVAGGNGERRDRGHLLETGEKVAVGEHGAFWGGRRPGGVGDYGEVTGVGLDARGLALVGVGEGFLQRQGAVRRGRPTDHQNRLEVS